MWGGLQEKAKKELANKKKNKKPEQQKDVQQPKKKNKHAAKESDAQVRSLLHTSIYINPRILFRSIGTVQEEEGPFLSLNNQHHSRRSLSSLAYSISV